VGSLRKDSTCALPCCEFALDEEGTETEPEQDETWVRPVDASAVPAVATAGALQIGQPILLANGRYLPYLPSAAAFLQPRPTAGEWLGAQLGMPVAELFPLRYILRVSIDGEAAPRSGNFD